MSKIEHKSQPNPGPQNVFAERLEHIRKIHGLRTLSDFHRELLEPRRENDDYEVSYAAVRNYHCDREPPASYLLRVADVFSIRLPWLLKGEGKPTEVEERLAELEAQNQEEQKPQGPNVWDILREELGPFVGVAGVPGGANREALDAALRLAEHEVRLDFTSLDDARVLKAAEQLGKYLRAALENAPVNLLEHPRELNPDSVNDFVVGACQAWKRLIPVPAEAKFIRMARATGLPVS